MLHQLDYINRYILLVHFLFSIWFSLLHAFHYWCIHYNSTLWFVSLSGPKGKESKRKDNLSIKPRSPVGANPVTSSRFTVSPADDPHLVWCHMSSWEPLELNPSETGHWINPNNQPLTQRLFFYWIGNWKNKTPVRKAGHIPGFTSDRILYDRGCWTPACHCLQSLFIAFGYKSLWKRQHMLGEEEPGAL